MIMFIRRAIVIIDREFAPTQIMISGPSATFGNEFSTVKNGSSTLAKNLFKYIRTLIKNAIPMPIIKAISISRVVARICKNNSPLETRENIVLTMEVGHENIKLFIKPVLAPISQIVNKEIINKH